MKVSVRVGMNRTGVQTSPNLSQEMIEGQNEFPVPDSRSEISHQDCRKVYIEETGDLGTVPIPASLKGAATTVFEKLTGGHPEVLVDKLGERLAFERTGARLYEALIAKCEALMPDMDLSALHEIHTDEIQHFHLIRETIEKIGGDPTVQTPCADINGVAAMGLLQVMTDPRTTIAQCAEVALIAELTDNDAWDLLIKLVRNAGLEEDAQKFEQAKASEEQHLLRIRRWVEELTLKDRAVQLQ